MISRLFLTILPFLVFMSCKKDNDDIGSIDVQLECRTTSMEGIETVDITYDADGKILTAHSVGVHDRLYDMLYDMLYSGDTTITLLGNDTMCVMVFNEHGLPIWARGGNYLIELNYSSSSELQGILVTVLVNGVYRSHWEVKNIMYQHGDMIAYTVESATVDTGPWSDEVTATYDTSMLKVDYDPTDVYQTFGFMMFARRARFLSPQMFSKHMLSSWVPSHMGGLNERTYSYELDGNGSVQQVITSFTDSYMGNDTLRLSLECL